MLSDWFFRTVAQIRMVFIKISLAPRYFQIPGQVERQCLLETKIMILAFGDTS